jgi:hypothetical protein
MMNDEPYSYQVLWSAEDEEFVGLCAEYPSLSYLHQDRYTALEGISNLTFPVKSENDDRLRVSSSLLFSISWS